MACEVCHDHGWMYIDPQLPNTKPLEDDVRMWVGPCVCGGPVEMSRQVLRGAASAARADGKRIGWALAVLWDEVDEVLIPQPWPFELANPEDPAAEVINDIYVDNEPDIADAADMWIQERELWPDHEVTRMCWTCFQIVHEGHPEEEFADGEWRHI